MLHLTRRQYEIVSLLSEGLTDREIAARLGVSVRTVSNILTRLYDRKAVQGRARMAYLFALGHFACLPQGKAAASKQLARTK